MVCQDANCTSDSLEIIKDACFDNTVLSTQMSIPLSTSIGWIPGFLGFLILVNGTWIWKGQIVELQKSFEMIPT